MPLSRSFKETVKARALRARRFRPRGNPRLANLSAVLRELNRREAVHLKVEPERLAD
jgi:hypothetical protein